MAKEVGKFTLTLEYDKLYIKRIHLWVPSLNLQKDHLLGKTVFEKMPRGNHRGVLTLYLANGRTAKQELMINIQPERENFQTVNLYELPQDVFIRPVDGREKTVLATEIKIEGVDSSFRPVRDEAGVSYSVRPGRYNVKIVTPGMEVKNFEIEIKEDARIYTLPVDEKGNLRNDPRVEINLPAAYQTEDGSWHSTRTLNISSHGVCMVREPRSRKDTRVFVRLLIPVAAKMVECFANVKWSRDSKVETNLMGLELEVDDETRDEIRKFLETEVSMKSSAHNFIRH